MTRINNLMEDTDDFKTTLFQLSMAIPTALLFGIFLIESYLLFVDDRSVRTGVLAFLFLHILLTSDWRKNLWYYLGFISTLVIQIGQIIMISTGTISFPEYIGTYVVLAIFIPIAFFLGVTQSPFNR